jgi:superfamily II DNA/RNA helicase
VIGIANTGTGKTAAFALPVLQRLMDDPNGSAIIVAPTRELAQQIYDECRSLGRGSGLYGVLLIGGVNMARQIDELRYRPRIVIGTPGRIKDHMQRGTLRLDSTSIVVLDEVDRMLDMGFVQDVTMIVNGAKPSRQLLLFSATMEQGVQRLIDGLTNDPVTVSLRTAPTSDSVHQDVVRYSDKDHKFEQLHELLAHPDVQKVIVFEETKYSVDRLSDKLLKHGYAADSIHGGKSQSQRDRALRKFKESSSTVLVATDVAARGIDVADITHVVNYSLPRTFDDYTHRIGRAGRAGRVGYAYTFVQQ